MTQLFFSEYHDEDAPSEALNPLVIVGTGGLGREVLALAHQINEHAATWQLVGFYDDRAPAAPAIHGLPYLGTVADLNATPEPLHVVVAVGHSQRRAAVVGRLTSARLTFATLIHPGVACAPYQQLRIGTGCIISQGCILTTDIQLGNHVLLNLGCTIGHDAVLDDFCSLMPHANVGGAAHLETGVYLGTNATVINQVRIGAHTTLGAAAVAIRDVPAGCTALHHLSPITYICLMRSQDYDRLYLSPPHLGRHELNYLHKAIEDNWVAPTGPNLDGFERDICEYTGAPHCVALNSGTAAIHLGLILLGVGPGDEVLCPSFTFVATANPVTYLGARPVFIDSEADTWNLCPVRLREALEDRIRQGRRPKALILVHLYGVPAKLREILAIAAEFDVPVLEDAAEALGSRYEGRPLGTFGAVGVFSFNGNKILTTSGGGALITANAAWARQTRYLATQAKDPAPHYQHSETGYNYRLSNLLAGIGRGQMELLEDRVKRRREIRAWYQEHLAEVPGLSVGPTELPGSRSNRWLTTILLDADAAATPEQLRKHLETRNIESRPLWKPLHLQPLFAGAPMYGGTVCTGLFQRGLCLPSGSAMTEADLRRVAEAIQEALPDA